jgi:hypothetical protein
MMEFITILKSRQITTTFAKGGKCWYAIFAYGETRDLELSICEAV